MWHVALNNVHPPVQFYLNPISSYGERVRLVHAVCPIIMFVPILQGNGTR